MIAGLTAWLAVLPLLPALPACTTAGGLAASPVSSGPPPSVDTVAAHVVALLNANDGHGLSLLYGARMHAQFPEKDVTAFASRLASSAGAILSFDRFPAPSDGWEASYHLDAERSDLRLDLQLDRDGTISGLRIEPDRSSEPPPVVSSTIALQLPFRGAWAVVWGGETAKLNHHVTAPSQRRAADLVVLGPDGVSHRSDGRQNEDYYAYGQDVLAVADGTVTTAVDGVLENVPGKGNRAAATGNYIVLRHADALYSLYAHLQPGKHRVTVGDEVKAGAVLGLCGNSGNSSEPHLHFQLQDGPLLERSWGVLPVFADVPVVRDGEPTTVKAYSFLKGDVVGVPQGP